MVKIWFRKSDPHKPPFAQSARETGPGGGQQKINFHENWFVVFVLGSKWEPEPASPP